MKRNSDRLAGVAEGRDEGVHITNQLLTLCVVPKAEYIVSTLPIQLAMDTAPVADDLTGNAFATINALSPAEMEAVNDKVRLPHAMKGCGLRSFTTIAPASVAATIVYTAPTVVSTLTDLFYADLAASPDDDPDHMLLRQAIDRARGVVSAQLDEAIAHLDDFGQALARLEFGIALNGDPKRQPAKDLQKLLTKTQETKIFTALAARAKQLSRVDAAHFNSCSSAWMQAIALNHMRLTNAEYTTRLRRHLRLPIPFLSAIRTGVDGKAADNYGDSMLSVHFKGNEWTVLSAANQDFMFNCGKKAGIPDVSKEARIVHTSLRRPGDVKCGAHGHCWRRALGKRLFLDTVTISAVCDTHASACAEKPGGGAENAAREKCNDYRTLVPFNCYFQPLAFESEGFTSKEVFQLLKAWATHWAEAGNRRPAEKSRLMRAWRNELAYIQAKHLAKCILSRAQKATEAQANSNGASRATRRPLVSDVDVHYAR
jgi:hypothetical protein